MVAAIAPNDTVALRFCASFVAGALPTEDVPKSCIAWTATACACGAELRGERREEHLRARPSQLDQAGRAEAASGERLANPAPDAVGVKVVAA